MTMQVSSPTGVSSLFFYFKDKIEQEIARSMSEFGEKTKLRDACEYALTNGGKRFRPLIVFLIGDALKNGLNVSEAALSTEFFHTASLIADDLPCMDNSDERRNKPSVHKIFGETIALLASYALMNAAFERIHKNILLMQKAPPPFSNFCYQAGAIVLECASRCAGILGATGGQFLDLYPPNYQLETIRNVIYKKTVTLYEGAFVGGWIFGGGEISKLENVKKAAFHFGMAFQIADDIADIEQDEKREKALNIVRLIGKEKSLTIFEEEMAKLKEQLKMLKLDTPSFEKMCDMLMQLSKS